MILEIISRMRTNSLSNTKYFDSEVTQIQNVAIAKLQIWHSNVFVHNNVRCEEYFDRKIFDTNGIDEFGTCYWIIT